MQPLILWKDWKSEQGYQLQSSCGSDHISKTGAKVIINVSDMTCYWAAAIQPVHAPIKHNNNNFFIAMQMIL